MANMTDKDAILKRLGQEVPPHNYPYLPTLYDAVIAARPKRIVEFGTRNGMTAICMALALREPGEGTLTAHDCWATPARSGLSPGGSQQHAQANIDTWAVADIVTLKHTDFWQWIQNPDDFDFMYFDIDNDGEKLLALYEGVKGRLAGGAVVYFEGGSVERDQVSWMIDLKRTPMTAVKDAIGYTVVDERFPSLSRFGG